MTNNDHDREKTNRARNAKTPDPTVTAALVSRRGVILAAVITAVLGLMGAVLVALINTSAQPAKGADDRGTPPRSSTQSAAGTQHQESKPAEAVPEQVKLDADTAVDLDEPGASPLSAPGPNGDMDLHFDGSTLASNRSGLFYYHGTEQEATAQCPKIVSEGKGTVPGPEVIFTGGQHCLRTSRGTVGWLSVNDVKIAANSGYIVLNYKLFR
ncbi:hypothetical protein [Amycolatopsis sp. EV170708-02-1]|uniref:hypothetical protein n=1 Tax=Amycolatopsis sp. EV170708-02-1 TaxID=2919322 RepID=UPI001F0C4A7D|nr:hypothetical protein [Amycolatopsis sp. EV170708-02-1]UMP04504.1 hypothetical protein MJQ72_06580 [Amycolatopsis sp. EV170708-02-1]